MTDSDTHDRLETIRQTVEYLSDYFGHLTTVSATAIVVVAAFVRQVPAGGARTEANVSLLGLVLCVVSSTLVKWAYGIERRDAATRAARALDPPQEPWAWAVSRPQRWSAVVIVGTLPYLAAISFIVGFAALALCATTIVAGP